MGSAQIIELARVSKPAIVCAEPDGPANDAKASKTNQNFRVNVRVPGSDGVVIMCSEAASEYLLRSGFRRLITDPTVWVR